MELGQIILRLSAYSIGVAVGLFAGRYWAIYNRRWGYALLAIFTVIAYGSGLLNTLSFMFTDIEYANNWVRLVVLATIAYVNPILMVLVMRADMAKDRQRRRVMEVAEEIGIDIDEFIGDTGGREKGQSG